MLEAYVPKTANPDDWDAAEGLSVNERTLVFEADLEPQDAQTFWRGFENATMPYCLASAWDKYRGYSWYDQLSKDLKREFPDVKGFSRTNLLLNKFRQNPCLKLQIFFNFLRVDVSYSILILNLHCPFFPNCLL
jgi:hypothetical protein